MMFMFVWAAVHGSRIMNKRFMMILYATFALLTYKAISTMFLSLNGNVVANVIIISFFTLILMIPVALNYRWKAKGLAQNK